MTEKKVYRKKNEIIFTIKSKRKGIMISKFLTSIKKLRVPDFVPNQQHFQEKDWLLNENQNSCYYYTKLFEYSKNNY